MAGLVLDRVSKRYGSVKVIEALSLTVLAGEFVVFLGPSGCGKTSLLRMIAGLEDVTEGRILLGDRDVTLAPPGQRNLAMVFQHYALYPHMSVRENLAFGLRNAGVPADAIERRIKEAARMLELAPLLARKPAELSGGQRQRVAIGRAVVKEPGIFLFDEPLSNLDAALRGRTRLELAQLHRRLDATMIFVTHDQIEAMTLATRIVVMNQGAIEQIATPTELYRRPATRFVAGFIGTPGMNFIEVERAAVEHGTATVLAAGAVQMRTRVPAAGLPGKGPLTLGVRAEHLHPSAEGVLPGVVELVEFLGERTLAHVRLSNGQLVSASVNGAVPGIGEPLRLAVELDDAHLFDAEGHAHHADATAVWVLA